MSEVTLHLMWWEGTEDLLGGLTRNTELCNKDFGKSAVVRLKNTIHFEKASRNLGGYLS